MKYRIGESRPGLVALAIFGLAQLGCVPGYVKASELEQRDQGPSACARSCEELGMRMVAMVLVGDTVPGCVCQVLATPSPTADASPPSAPAVTAPPATLPAPQQPGSLPPTSAPAAPTGPGAALAPNDAVHGGAAASSAGFVVIAAAAAARRQQAQQDWQRQQLQYHK